MLALWFILLISVVASDDLTCLRDFETYRDACIKNNVPSSSRDVAIEKCADRGAGLFEIASLEELENLPPIIDPIGYIQLVYGCFEHATISQFISETLTTSSVKECLVHCRSSSRRYAGLRGSECNCWNANDFETVPRIGLSQISCTEGRQYCTSNTVSVYDVSDPINLSALFIGCLDEPTKNPRMASWRDLNGLQPIRCIRECQAHGFRYAGIKAARCHCDSTEIPENSLETDSSNPCQQNGLFCESTDHLSVFDTNLIASPMQTAFQGCFSDTFNAQSVHHLLEYFEPFICINICLRNGYQFAGMKSGNFCYCFNNKNDMKPLPHDDCNSTCNTPYFGYCGGPSAISVFELDSSNTVWLHPTRNLQNPDVWIKRDNTQLSGTDLSVLFATSKLTRMALIVPLQLIRASDRASVRRVICQKSRQINQCYAGGVRVIMDCSNRNNLGFAGKDQTVCFTCAQSLAKYSGLEKGICHKAEWNAGLPTCTTPFGMINDAYYRVSRNTVSPHSVDHYNGYYMNNYTYFIGRKKVKERIEDNPNHFVQLTVYPTNSTIQFIGRYLVEKIDTGYDLLGLKKYVGGNLTDIFNCPFFERADHDRHNGLRRAVIIAKYGPIVTGHIRRCLKNERNIAVDYAELELVDRNTIVDEVFHYLKQPDLTISKPLLQYNALNHGQCALTCKSVGVDCQYFTVKPLDNGNYDCKISDRIIRSIDTKESTFFKLLL